MVTVLLAKKFKKGFIANDDQVKNLKLLKAYLAFENYGIITAENGKDALREVSQNPPAVILLDVMMP